MGWGRVSVEVFGEESDEGVVFLEGNGGSEGRKKGGQVELVSFRREERRVGLGVLEKVEIKQEVQIAS